MKNWRRLAAPVLQTFSFVRRAGVLVLSFSASAISIIYL
jgi:hypothetical protein